MSRLARLVAPEPLELVMFDLDGTLIDSVPDLHAAIAEMDLLLGRPQATLGQVREWVGNGAAMLVQRALSGRLDVPQAAPTALFEHAYATFLRCYERVNGQHAQLYEGVHELLALLAEQGIKTAIVTNKPAQFTHALLAKNSLKVDFVVAGDSLAQMKPAPEPLLHCIASAQTQAERSVMVGDSLSDVRAARAAKVAVACVSYGYNHGQSVASAAPDLIIDSLLELR